MNQANNTNRRVTSVTDRIEALQIELASINQDLATRSAAPAFAKAQELIRRGWRIRTRNLYMLRNEHWRVELLGKEVDDINVSRGPETFPRATQQVIAAILQHSPELSLGGEEAPEVVRHLINLTEEEEREPDWNNEE